MGNVFIIIVSWGEGELGPLGGKLPLSHTPLQMKPTLYASFFSETGLPSCAYDRFCFLKRGGDSCP